jgi:tetratricopeptide (TPR) repeat protein
VDPQQAESLTLLRADLLAAQGRLAEARAALIEAAQKDPKNVRFRVALARVADQEKRGAEAIKLLDEAEKELGPSVETMLARLDHWLKQGGAEAKAGLESLAQTRGKLPAKDMPLFLDQLATAEARLGEPALARVHRREALALEPNNVARMQICFQLALAANDLRESRDLVERMHRLEGETGTLWRFSKAELLIDEARKGDLAKLNEARSLVDGIKQTRPDWWGAPFLSAQVYEISSRPEQVLAELREAFRLGNSQPTVARRLVAMLYERNQFDELDRVTRTLGERGVALDDLTIFEVIKAVRAGEFDRALELARTAVPAGSTNYADHLLLGRIKTACGRVDEAQKEFQRAVELAPTVPETWLARLRGLVQRKRLPEAKALLEQARQALPGDRASLTLARGFHLLGDAQQTEACLDKALAEQRGNSDSQETLQFACDFYLGQGRMDKVVENLDQLEKSKDRTAEDQAWVNRMRGVVLLRNGHVRDAEKALGLIEENLKQNPEQKDDLKLQAVLLATKASRRGQAIRLMERLERDGLFGPGERFSLAQLYLAEGNQTGYQGQILRLVSETKPVDPLHLAHYVRFLTARRRLVEARTWLSELKKTDPQGLGTLQADLALLKAEGRDDRQMLSLLSARGKAVPAELGQVAALLSGHGFLKEAEEAYRTFASADPKQPERTLDLAGFLAQHGRAPEAFELLARAKATCRPGQVASVAVSLYDVLCTDENRRRQVESWASEAIEKSPDMISLATRMAAFWLQQGRFEEAEDMLRRVLLSSPDDPAALNNLAWLLAFRDKERASEAQELIDRAIEVDGPDPTLLDTRAVVLIQQGRLDQAIDQLTRAVADHPAAMSFARHLAWAHEAKGNVEEARKEFSRAESLGLKPLELDPLERAVVEQLRSHLFPG